MTKVLFGLVVSISLANGQIVWGEYLPDPVPVKVENARNAQSPSEVSEATLPHLAMGGYWQTTLVVTNLSKTNKSKTTIAFWNPQGLRMEVEFQVDSTGQTIRANTINVELPPMGTLRLTSTAGPSTVVGWATYDWESSSPYGGVAAVHAIFRQQVPSRPPYEAVVQPDSGSSGEIITPFYNENGFTTSLAIANYSNYSNRIVVTIRDQNGGQLGWHTYDLDPRQQMAFESHRIWPETANRSGTISIDPYYSIASLAFQFGPDSTGVFTTSFWYFLRTY